MRTGLLLGLIAGILLSVVAIVGVVVFRLTRPLPDEVLPPLSATHSLTITADESLLTDMATAAAHERDPNLERVIADVQPGGRVDLTMGAQVVVAGRRVDVQVGAAGLVAVQGGRLRVSVEQVELAGVPISVELLPQSLQDLLKAVVDDVNEQAAQALFESGLEPVAVTSDARSLTLFLRAMGAQN